jgi:AraC family transcriptional regulator
MSSYSFHIMRAYSGANFGRLGEMKFSLRASSNGRFWNGFEAATYDISPGFADRPPATNYVLVMHLSTPVSGTARCEGPTLFRLMRPGDIDIVPLGCAATWRDDAPGSVLNVRLSPTLIRSTAQTMNRVNPDALCISPQLHLKDRKLEHLGWALVAELEEGDPHDRLLADSIGTALAAHLLTRFSSARASNAPQGLSRRQLQSVIDYINENLSEDLSLAELAVVAGVSVSHFKALFRHSVGVPVHQYVIRQRIDFAMRLLARSDARLCEIAQQAGFADQSHMTRSMRRTIGITPAALLRQYR